MTAPTAPFTDFATTAQERFTDAVRTWADTLQAATDDLTAKRPTLVQPDVLVDRYFDFAQQVLDRQREFTRSVLSAGTEAAQTVTEQTAAAAKNITAQTVSAVESTTEQATAASTRAAKPAAKK